MNVLNRLFGRGCSHRFTWPRIDADGRHYQICPLCGTAYEYATDSSIAGDEPETPSPLDPN
jgi:hypothetical protein